MTRQTEFNECGRRLAVALSVIMPVLLAGCVQESPAYVVDAEHGPATYEGQARTYTVVARDGDSVSGIAERCDVSVATIERMNDFDDRPLYPGETVRVPSHDCAERAAERHETHMARADADPYAVHPTPRPRRIVQARYEPDAAQPQPRPDRYGSDDDQNAPANHDDRNSWWSWWSKPADDTQADTGSVQFMWPVRGRVIEGFGRGGNGERNDGINIATEEGAPIRAAAAGTVTYAGNELKGYGNLVLIKHSDGYVTAYAHAESISVSRGDAVEKGQVIGTAGATGDVDRPQLHFEIRRGVQPVDPARFLVADRAS